MIRSNILKFTAYHSLYSTKSIIACIILLNINYNPKAMRSTKKCLINAIIRIYNI
jgi:hypothetical protein